MAYNKFIMYLDNYYYISNVTNKDYYICNNDSLDYSHEEVQEIYKAVSLDVDIVFSALNIMPCKSGYLFWKDAVFLYIISEKQRVQICKDIYETISKKYQTTSACVDRAMRRCFESALFYAGKNKNNYICSYLKNSVLYPHNSELLSKIVELIVSKEFQVRKVNQSF